MKVVPLKPYDAACRDCPRLASFLDEVRSDNPGYFCGPVPSFGPTKARLLIVGLAPGMHGANRTGRPFTGDFAGILLYATLHKFGFASHAGSADPADGLELSDCRITNAVKCLPPQNKPDTAEIRRCNRFLKAEMETVKPKAILALGRIAHDAVLHAAGLKPKDFVFAHAAVHELPGGARLHDSYHCSRYNTQTRRLTAEMFESVVKRIAADLRR
jgi:uracil-DNA glycosylase family 4